jgi:hypothetical protein
MTGSIFYRLAVTTTCGEAAQDFRSQLKSAEQRRRVGRWPLLSCDLQEIEEYTMFQILFQNYQNNVFKLYKFKFLSATN